MVPPVLADTKTQTRRIMSPQPSHWSHYIQPMWGTSPPPNPVEFGEKWLWREVGPDYPDDTSDDRRCPYGQPGDRLWVREAWRTVESLDEIRPSMLADRVPIRYEADGFVRGKLRESTGRYRHARFMPRWISRITLEVTNVRCERLHDITDADAKAEGVEPLPFERKLYPSKHAATVTEWSHRAAFQLLWESINGAESWRSNPWVWVVEFKRLESVLTTAQVQAALIAGSKVRAAAERNAKRAPRR